MMWLSLARDMAVAWLPAEWREEENESAYSRGARKDGVSVFAHAHAPHSISTDSFGVQPENTLRRWRTL